MNSMNGLLGVAVLALLPGAGSGGEPGVPDRTTLTAQADAVIERFASRLQTRLQDAMGKGGPVNAIDVCKLAAPEITASVSGDSPWRIARTSLRVRNPDNAPDGWERRVLQEFDARHADGEPIPELVRLELFEAGGGHKQARYMRAIATKPLCLSCHGENLAPDVVRALDKLYPKDEARGFAAGEIRGAFTLRKPL